MAERYDLIVCGVGGIGSAALLAAAQAGLRVLGIEQFGYAHDRGSSHGQTRIIRTAYFEHPDYVPLAQESWRAWEEIQRRSDTLLLRSTGLIQVGLPESEVVRGVLASARRYDLPVREMTSAEVESRWPVFRIDPNEVGVFEEQAGYLRVERCVAQMIAQAKESGAEFLANQRVVSWNVEDNGDVVFRTTTGEFRALRAVLAAGPWSSQLIGDLGLDLRVVRKQQQWFQMDRPDVHEANGLSCFLFDQPDGVFYGFPAIDSLGVKVAEHSGGDAVSDPTMVDRELHDVEYQRVLDFVRKRFRFSRIRLTHYSVCMYTKSVDEHFIVDRHPQFPQVSFVCGLSGHGFKFAPVLGRHAVGLVSGRPNPHCRFLGLRRLAIEPGAARN